MKRSDLIAALDRDLANELELIARILAKLTGPPRRRRTGSRRRFWTEGERAEVRRLYPDTSTAEIARRLDRRLSGVYQMAHGMGLEKSPEYMRTPAAIAFIRPGSRGELYRFRKGHAPVNKGLRRPGFAPGRMAATQFRKGERPHTWVPIGTEVRDTEGYLKRKISDDRTRPSRFNWKYVHTLTWEAANGPVPRGQAVAFKDHDKNDTRIENLELVTRQELMRRNTVHNLPPELARVVQLRGALIRQINRRARG